MSSRIRLLGRVVVLVVGLKLGDHLLPATVWSLAKAGILLVALVLARLQERDSITTGVPFVTQLVLAFDLSTAASRYGSGLGPLALLLYTAPLALLAVVTWRRGLGQRDVVLMTYVVGIALLTNTVPGYGMLVGYLFPTPALGVVLAVWLIQSQQSEHSGGQHVGRDTASDRPSPSNRHASLTPSTWAVLVWGWIPWMLDLVGAYWLLWPANSYPSLALVVFPNFLVALLNAPPVVAISIHAFYGYHIALHVVGILFFLGVGSTGWLLRSPAWLYLPSLVALIAAYRAGTREKEAAEVESNMRDFGTPVPPSTLRCAKCGTVNNAERWFCLDCKTNLHT